MTERRVVNEVVDDDGTVVEIDAVVNEAEPCIHDLDKAWCSICKHGLAKVERELEVVGHFTARFNGSCAECGRSIFVGDTVARLSNDTYVHGECV